jgi:hypothetical protein
MSNIIQLPPPPDEPGNNPNEDRNKRLLDWANMVLVETGLAKAIRQAASIAELRDLVFDQDNPAIALAIRDALYPFRLRNGTAGARCQHAWRHRADQN